MNLFSTKLFLVFLLFYIFFAFPSKHLGFREQPRHLTARKYSLIDMIKNNNVKKPKKPQLLKNIKIYYFTTSFSVILKLE